MGCGQASFPVREAGQEGQVEGAYYGQAGCEHDGARSRDRSRHCEWAFRAGFGAGGTERCEAGRSKLGDQA